MRKTITGLFFLTVVLLSNCAKIYYSPDAKSKASRHKIIAIAPPRVSIAAIKNVDLEALKEQQRTESINFQKEMYSWLLEAISKMPAGPKSRLMTEFSVHFFRQRHHFVCKKWP